VSAARSRGLAEPPRGSGSGKLKRAVPLGRIAATRSGPRVGTRLRDSAQPSPQNWTTAGSGRPVGSSVIAFIFADLIVLPILNIYRRYDGSRMSLFLLGTFYLTMAAAGLLVDRIFEALGLVPIARNAKVVEASITLDYTSILNVVVLVLAAVLVVRFLRTAGRRCSA
jgi:hypothetical protein